MTGRSCSPSAALASAHLAFAISCEPAAVPASRANWPIDPAAFFVAMSSVAWALAAASAVPVSLSCPRAASSACTVAADSPSPYFSEESYSPRRVAPSASTASAAVPPKVAARSAPRLIIFADDSAALAWSNPRDFSDAPIAAEAFA